jgi:hypothetical protein
MSNSNVEPRVRVNADPRRLDPATFDGGVIIIRKNISTNGDCQTVKVKDEASAS